MSIVDVIQVWQHNSEIKKKKSQKKNDGGQKYKKYKKKYLVVSRQGNKDELVNRHLAFSDCVYSSSTEN